MMFVVDDKDPLRSRGITKIVFSRRAIDFTHSIDTMIFSNHNSNLVIWQSISTEADEFKFKTSILTTPHYVYQKNDDGYELKQTAINDMDNQEMLDRLNQDLILAKREFMLWKFIKKHRRDSSMINKFMAAKAKFN